MELEIRAIGQNKDCYETAIQKRSAPLYKQEIKIWQE